MKNIEAYSYRLIKLICIQQTVHDSDEEERMLDELDALWDTLSAAEELEAREMTAKLAFLIHRRISG